MTIKELKDLLKGYPLDTPIEIELLCGNADSFTVDYDKSVDVVVLKEF